MFFVAAALAFACAAPPPATPVETFKTYTKAAKNKDLATMKLLLSSATLKMHEQEAEAQHTTLDEIIQNQTLVGQNQKTVEYRDEKIDGDKATLRFKNEYGVWETLPFVREDGVWKIDKQGYADQMIQDIEEQQKQAFGDQDAGAAGTGGTPTPETGAGITENSPSNIDGTGDVDDLDPNATPHK
jgi:hypothetical protein